MKTILFLMFGVLISPLAIAAGQNGGGENGINGRPLESYAVDITSTAEYKTVINPLLARLKNKIPTLGSYFEGVAKNKAWYFVPVNLDAIPSPLIGVAFPTDQMALPSANAVWVSTPQYPNSLNDRAHLLVHEMIMSFLICSGGVGTYRRLDPLSGYCYQTPMLSQFDYDHIRSFVVALFNMKDSDAPDSIRDEAFADGIGTYYFLTPVPANAQPTGSAFTVHKNYSCTLKDSVSN